MSASRKLKRRQDAQNGKLKPARKLKDMYKTMAHDPFMDADFQAKLAKAAQDLEPRIIGMVGHREGMSHEASLKILGDLISPRMLKILGEMRSPRMGGVLVAGQDESHEKLMRDLISEMETDIKKVLESLPREGTIVLDSTSKDPS